MTKDVQIQKIAQLTGHEASIFSVAPGPDRQHFLSGGGDGWVVRWNLDDPETGRLIARVDTQIFSLLYLEDREKVVVGNMNGGVHWVDLQDPNNTQNIAHHRKGVFDIQRIDDYVFTLGGGGLLTRWSIPEERSLESYQLTNQALRSMDYHPERREIAIGASDNAIYLLDADTLQIRHQLRDAHDNSVFTVHYTPDGHHLLSGGRDAHLKVWTLNSEPELVSEQPAHWFTINDIAFHPSGKWFATASRDKTIKIWEAGSWQLLKVIDATRTGGHINSVNRLFWSPHRDWLISCSDDRSLIVWEGRFDGSKV